MPIGQDVEAQCQAIYAYRCQHAGDAPSHSRNDAESSRLGIKKNKLKIRCVRPLSSRPGERKLNAEEKKRFDFCLACPIVPSGKLPAMAIPERRASFGTGVAASVPLMAGEVGPGLSRGRVFVKSVHVQFATATASGDKFFECSTKSNMFKNMSPGDFLLLVQTKSQQRVVAVGEVSGPPVRRESSHEILYERLPARLHAALESYLGGAVAFDYVQFSKVYDLRDCNMKVEELLSRGSLRLNPRHNLGMGVLPTESTSENAVHGLQLFLSTQLVRWP
jgi:hypothetical protein